VSFVVRGSAFVVLVRGSPFVVRFVVGSGFVVRR